MNIFLFDMWVIVSSVFVAGVLIGIFLMTGLGVYKHERNNH